MRRKKCKKIQRLTNISYKPRLKALNLHFLERSRLKGDLIEVFKSSNGYNKGDISRVVTVNNQNITRNNGFKLEKFKF